MSSLGFAPEEHETPLLAKRVRGSRDPLNAKRPCQHTSTFAWFVRTKYVTQQPAYGTYLVQTRFSYPVSYFTPRGRGQIISIGVFK